MLATGEPHPTIEALHVAALMHAQFRQSKQAETLWRRCVELAPQSEQYRVNLAAIAMEADVPAAPFKNVRAALDWLRADFEKASKPPRILIGGSLYLAGDVLRQNGPLPE